jgi:hypothetical protein
MDPNCDWQQTLAENSVKINSEPLHLAGDSKAPHQPRFAAPRWKKRVLFGSCAIGLLAGIGWATSPRPKLLKPTEAIASQFEPSVREVASRVDDAIDQEIERLGLPKASDAPWMTVARRLSLALIGNGLSIEEIRVLEQVPEQDRIAWWAEYLLQDRRSSDYLAERWTRATVGTNQGPVLLFRRRKYVDWLAEHN